LLRREQLVDELTLLYPNPGRKELLRWLLPQLSLHWILPELFLNSRDYALSEKQSFP
ncbi:unnamed protein product, partial [marine sediment metagenome]